jgi:hypothetical protein
MWLCYKEYLLWIYVLYMRYVNFGALGIYIGIIFFYSSDEQLNELIKLHFELHPDVGIFELQIIKYPTQDELGIVNFVETGEQVLGKKYSQKDLLGKKIIE